MPIQNGYRYIRIPKYRKGCQDDGRGHFYYREHVLVAEGILGRQLREDEIVHHIDGDKLNNDPGNLMVLRRADHSRAHTTIDNPNRLKPGAWSHKWSCCRACGTTERPHYARGMCEECYRRYRRQKAKT
jgi:hypothetical protein